MAIDLFSETPEFFTWACIMVKRDVLEKFGLLDERYFMYWEDVEYGLRLSGCRSPRSPSFRERSLCIR